MSDLQKEAERWHGRVDDLIEMVYQVKDGGLGNPFGEAAKWHNQLSAVAAELRLLHAWLAHVATL